MPRKALRRRRPKSEIPGLTRRGNRAYYVRSFPEAVGGDRISKGLGAEWGSEVVSARAAAVNQLWDRGDWPILRRWQAGDIHITRIVRATREGDHDQLKRLNSEGVLLAPAIEAHLQRIEATREGASTLRTHKSVCDALLEAFGAEYPMEMLTKEEAQQFLWAPKRTMKGEPWAPESQRLYRMVAGALWRYTAELDAELAEKKHALPTLTKNPWSKAEIRIARKTRPAVLTEEEVRNLLAHPLVAGTPKALLLGIACYAGLRQQEIAHLRPELDVQIDGPEPIIRVQGRKGERAWRTKTERSERDVPIPPALVQLIRDHVRRGYSGTRYLLRSPRGDRPLSNDTLERWTEIAFTAVGLKYGRKGDGLTLHNCRHTYATVLLSHGMSIALVAEWMGDTQAVVLETYSHTLPRDRALGIRILENVARPTETP